LSEKSRIRDSASPPLPFDGAYGFGFLPDVQLFLPPQACIATGGLASGISPPDIGGGLRK